MIYLVWDSLKTLLISSGEVLTPFTIQKIDISSANSFMFDIRLSGGSFIYMKNNNEHKDRSLWYPCFNQFPVGIMSTK